MADHPTLRQLDILIAVLDHGGFRDAARALDISQVAVSDHIKQLEAKLGISLFVREKGGRAHPNAIAQAMRDDAIALIAQADALVVRVHALASGADGARPAAVAPARAAAPAQARILTDETADPPAIPAADVPAADTQTDRPVRLSMHNAMLGRFQAVLLQYGDVHPDRPVALDLEAYTAEAIVTRFAEEASDVACFYALGGSRLLTSQTLWTERMMLFVGAGHSLADQGRVSAADLSDQPMLAFDRGHPLRAIIGVIARAAGLNADDPVLESDDFAALRQAVVDGVGVLPLFGALASQFASLPGIHRLPFGDPLPHVEVRRAVRHGQDEDEAIAMLAAMLR